MDIDKLLEHRTLHLCRAQEMWSFYRTFHSKEQVQSFDQLGETIVQLDDHLWVHMTLVDLQFGYDLCINVSPSRLSFLISHTKAYFDLLAQPYSLNNLAAIVASAILRSNPVG